MRLSKGLPKDFLRFCCIFWRFFVEFPFFVRFLVDEKINRKNVAKGVDSFWESAKVTLS